MVYTVTLNPALDYYMSVEEISSDVSTAEKAALCYGGKGINVSVVLSRLAIDSTALGFAGGFSGEKLLELLSAEKIKADFVKIDGDTRINVKIQGARELAFNAKGPEITEADERRLLDKISQIHDGDYLVLAGSVPGSMGSNAYERIIAATEGKSIKLVVDTTGAALRSTLSHKPFLVKPNNFELEEFFGRTLSGEDELVSAARELQALGAENVLISRGSQGMMLVDSNGDITTVPVMEGDVVNTTGCGDSTVAGFIAGYIKKNDYGYALRVANACANATAFSEGLAGEKEIFSLLGK